MKTLSGSVVDFHALDSQTNETVVDLDLVQKGDIVKVYPGERLPTDGVIINGSSFIDESLITGSIETYDDLLV